nr:trypsin-like peptidase domain-containing protein [Clostridia bacterium]
MKKRLSVFFTCLIALTLAVVMASGCSFIDGNSRSRRAASPSDSEIAAQNVNFETTPKERNIEDAFIEAVAKVKRTSVQILTDSSAGSGVIVDISFAEESNADWKQDEDMLYIITCHHMVSVSGSYGTQGVGEIEIRLPDEDCSYTNADYVFHGYIGNKEPSYYASQGYAITLVGGDFESDIAVLKLDLDKAAHSGKKLSQENKAKIQKAQIPDDSYNVSLGETVFSIGNPTGTLPGSVARGIISCLNRSVDVDEIGAMSLMQIDVSTNPGSSGGGLYNLYGELIGITNAGNTNYTNINFAIPCYLANDNGFVDIVKQLGGTASEDNYGYVSGRRVKLGFSVMENDDDSESPFLYVSSVGSGSLAYGKLQANDVIKTVSISRNGEEILSRSVSTLDEFAEVMAMLEAGDVLTISASRYSWGRTKNITADIEIQSFWFCDTGY